MKALLNIICAILLPCLLSAANLTVEEKVGQLLMVHFHGEEANDDARALIQDLHVGAFTYYNWANGLHSPQQVLRLSTGLQELARIPLLIAVDQEGGRVARLKEGFPVFPSNQTVAQTEDPALAEYAAYVTGLELRKVGVNMNLAPVVDVNCNPRNPVINNRSFGDHPEMVIAFGRSALQGYHRAGVITSLKHYPGHGDVEVDSHFALPIVNKPLAQLEQTELLPFRTLAPYADTIMTAHIQVPALDPEERCATISKNTLDYLRHNIGFKGVIISDSLVMQGVLNLCSTVDEAAIQAIEAGCDMLILGGKQLVQGNAALELSVNDIRRIHQALVKAVLTGRITESRLNEAVERVLSLKSRYALQAAILPTTASESTLTISDEEIHQIAQKIWKNECKGSVEGLTHWNSGEQFGSFGIGHFIWYTKNNVGRFHETFPDLLVFLQTHGVQLPEWLKQADGCPWTTLEEFNLAKQSQQMKELRQLLYDTRDHQAVFIAQRLEKALPQIIEKLPTESQIPVSQTFYALANDGKGLYALIDYVNFKGEGTSPTESYNGYGWGLLQVLQRIPQGSEQPVQDFVKAAKIVLAQRVENSPPARNEKKWLKGWFNRVDTYVKE